MSISVPAGLRHAVTDEVEGPGWLESLGELVERAVQRWDLVVGEPFETGVAAWTAPAVLSTGTDVVLKLSFPHREALDEAAALGAWAGVGAVELLGADAGDWALLLRRLQPGSSLRDAALPTDRHLLVGAEVMRRLATVRVPPGEPFQDLIETASSLATVLEERMSRLLPEAPYPVDAGVCHHAVDLLRSLPGGADRCGLAHGDLNPGNILRHVDASSGVEGGTGEWLAIDPKPVHGDLAWDPWPLLTQVGDWLTVVPSAEDLADRTRLVADVTGLDAARIASWCIARSAESGLWAADRGWWSGFRGADGDLAGPVPGRELPICSASSHPHRCATTVAVGHKRPRGTGTVCGVGRCGSRTARGAADLSRRSGAAAGTQFSGATKRAAMLSSSAIQPRTSSSCFATLRSYH